MVGETVAVAPRADIEWEEMRSVVSLTGAEVRSGTLTVDRILGANPDGAGQILEGTLRLELAGDRTARGSFVILAMTWG